MLNRTPLKRTTKPLKRTSLRKVSKNPIKKLFIFTVKAYDGGDKDPVYISILSENGDEAISMAQKLAVREHYKFTDIVETNIRE